jgi:diacylglycerol kinase (ATP)
MISDNAKAMLVYNPAAGQRQAEVDLARAVQYLEGHGWQICWRQTHGPGDATTYAREAVAAGFDVVIAAGGDGTVGQVVNGLAGTQTALGVLPCGTTNVWAKECGLPLWSPLRPNALLEAAEILTGGETRRVDVGRVNGRYFLMWAGIGFDAQVTAHVEAQPETKRRLGKLAFGIAVIVQTLNLSGTKAHIEIDGHRMSSRVFLVVASNIHLYADIIRLAPQASLYDGRVDVFVFRAYTGIEALRLLTSLLLGLHTRTPEVKCHQARRMVVRTSKPLPVHADGDVVGTTPVEIDVVPQCLDVIVPAHLPYPPARWPRASREPRAAPASPLFSFLPWMRQ